MLGAVLALALVIPPAPTARVNDYAGILAAGDRTRLEALLAERERTTGVQMVIAIFPSLEGENLEDVSIQLAQQWKIGREGLDNGVILLVFVRDQKLRLEVGYGLEAVIPDAVAGQIIREVVAPRFRGGRYVEGLDGAVRAVFSRVQEGSEPRTSAWRWPLSPRDSILAILILAVLGYVLYGASRVRGRHRRKIYTLGPGGWGVPSDPSWGGGGWSWGSGNSGGFSGGGGSFGGGGASGEW